MTDDGFDITCDISDFKNTSIKDTVDTMKIDKRFACANEQHKGHFG